MMATDDATLACLVVGAHPDDAEIGAGGLIQSLKRRGWTVVVVVVTEGDPDGDLKEKRRIETQHGLSVLGVEPRHIYSFGQPQNEWQVTTALVEKLRDLHREYDFSLIVTHTARDNHQDHQKTSMLVSAALRSVPILLMDIPTSTRLVTFVPSFFVLLSEADLATKERAIDAHRSQVTMGRICPTELCQNNRVAGQRLGLSAAEGFEVQLPTRMVSLPRWLTAINASPLHMFWHQVMGQSPVAVVLQGTHGGESQFSIAARGRVFAAAMDLRSRLSSLLGPARAIESFPDIDEAAIHIHETHSVVYIGGRRSNRAALRFAARSRHRLWFSIRKAAKNAPSVIRTRAGDVLRSEPRPGGHDYGLITYLRQPRDGGHGSLWLGGISSWGTTSSIQFVADPISIQQLRDRLSGDLNSFQALLKVGQLGAHPEADLVEARHLPDNPSTASPD